MTKSYLAVNFLEHYYHRYVGVSGYVRVYKNLILQVRGICDFNQKALSLKQKVR